MKTIASLLIMCLAHNSVASVYLATGVLFFTPFSAIADAFIDQANDGKNLGGTLRSDFVLPEMDAASGTMTLKNGVVNGQTVQQNELFQEIIPGSMDAAVASYGNSDAMGTHINEKLDELGSSGTNQGIAYQTLLGANTAMPNMKDDPLWQTSDNVLGQKSSDINDKFTGCQKNSTYTEKSCSVHVKDLRTCKKSAKAEKCRVQRLVNVTDDAVNLFSMDGVGTVKKTLLDEVEIQIGKPDLDAYGGERECLSRTDTMTLDVKDENRIASAFISYAAADDNIKLTIDGNAVLDTGTCTNVDEWKKTFSIDVSNHLKKGRHEIKLYTYSNISRLYGGWATITLRQKLTNEFTDSPVGCRARVSDVWPPQGDPLDRVITDSLEDQAFTPWWQCTDASHQRTFGGLAVDSSVPETFRAFHDILPEPPQSPPAPICYSAETRIPGHVKLPCFTDIDGYQQCPEFDYNTD